jgi:hypothetical protein
MCEYHTNSGYFEVYKDRDPSDSTMNKHHFNHPI